jgi:general secretion pathway protein L
MAEQLILHLDSLHTDGARWLVLDARGNRIGFPQRGQLADAAPLTAQRRVVVLLPGEEILQLVTLVPGRNRQQIMRAAPFAIEDRVASGIDKLFVALLDAGDASTPSRFAVIEHTVLQACLQRLDDAGIRPDMLLPDHAALPAPAADEAHWWLLGTRLLVRDATQGFAAPIADAGLLAKRIPEDIAVHVLTTGDVDLPDSLASRIDAGNSDVTELDTDRLFTELAANAAARKDGGLLQQRYKAENRQAGEWRRWRNAAIVAGLVVVLGLSSWSVDVYRLQRESAFLEQQMESLFMRAMPDARFDPATAAAQMRVRLRGSTSNGDAYLLQLLNDVGAALSTVSDARFKGFSFRNDRLEISISVKDAQSLENLQNALRERSAADIQLRSANSDGDRLEGRIVLTGTDGGAA